MSSDDDETVWEEYDPAPLDVLIPDEMLIPAIPQFPMFRYRVLLSYKEPGTGQHEGRFALQNQRSWPCPDLTSTVIPSYGGLDRFIRANCRQMVLEILNNMFPEDPLGERIMKYTGQWYVSPMVQHPAMGMGLFTGGEMQTCGAISFLGYLPV